MIDSYIQQYGRRLYGLCLVLCANKDDADDLYQDTWLKALQHFSRYDPSRPFEPWLTKICVNTYRNALRRAARSPFLYFNDSEERERTLSAIPAPEQEDYSVLYDAILRLPEKLRITVVLFYFQDMEIHAVAQTLNLPPGTVKSRLNRARKMLKEGLSNAPDL
ncbi:MAG: RNA polymerase sigma factor [Clostridia bacterium]